MTTNLVSEFSKYAQVQRLGEGGFGEVYQAVDTTLNRPVALKVPHQELVRDPAFVQQFYTEAQLAAQLDHPNIVRIYSVGEYQGTPYLEMELVEGQTLAELIGEKGRFTPEEALAIIEPVCEALAEAHRKGIVHQDIKPQNILIRESDGRVLVSDFGLAKATQSSFQASLSSSNVVVGTFRYMPPEQANRKLGEIGPRSDIYSLGVVLYEMLTGRVPFESDSVGQLIYEHTTEPPEPPSNININLSRAVELVVLKALEKKPTDRFPSALVMAQSLRAAVEEGIAMPPTFEPVREAVQPSTEEIVSSHLGWRRLLILSLALLLLLSCGALVFLPDSAMRTIVPPIATAIAEAGQRRATAIVEAGQRRATAIVEAGQRRATAIVEAEHVRATATAEAMHAAATATTEAEHVRATATAEVDPERIWERIQSLTLVEQFAVPADGTRVPSNIPLQKGAPYTIVVYGQFTWVSGWSRVSPGLCDAESESTTFLTIDGARHEPVILADAYRHRYAYHWSGGGKPIWFSIYDTDYSNNAGGLVVEIREGTP